MIQANLLMITVGRSPDSFVQMDIMRLPLGILSGMGFIGAGAILRKDERVLGVTTAATLWAVTVMGLCFGGGQIGLGLAALVIGAVTLWILKWFELKMKQDRQGILSLQIAQGAFDEEEVRSILKAENFEVIRCAVSEKPVDGLRELNCVVRWRSCPTESVVPLFVKKFSRMSGAIKVEWKP
jgi:putative Mg2+ transporter-C (MgtC) family protein